MAETEAATTGGLEYPPGFLASLPTLLSRPAPFAPIRALSASQFAEIQQLHALADEDKLGDSVLFPFLHGIEGNNVSQNTFFAGNTRSSSIYGHPLLPPVNPSCKIPKYRGLIWVRADEHDGIVRYRHEPHMENWDMDDEDEDEDESEDEQLSSHSHDNSDNHNHDHNHSHSHSHSHSPNHNHSPNAIAIPGRTPRSPSISTSNSSSEPAFSLSPSTAPTSFPPSPSSIQCPSTPFTAVHSHLLTSTLRVQDLLVSCPDGPRFAPPRVPDGISL